MPMNGDKRGHDCLAWKVRMPDGRIVGGGSLFPNAEGCFVWLDTATMHEIMAVVALLEEKLAESERRDAVSVRLSSVEDWE